MPWLTSLGKATTLLAWLFLFSGAAGQQSAPNYPPGCELENTESLQCIGTSLDDILAILRYVPNNVTALHVQDCNPQTGVELTETSFSDITRVETLEISYCNITGIANGTFKDMQSLNSLTLRHDNIVNLTRAMFEGLHNLSVLSVAENMIGYLTVDVFDNLASLDILDLNSNSLVNFGPVLKYGINKLILRNNPLHEITAPLPVCDLDLSLTQMSELYAYMFAGVACSNGPLSIRLAGISFTSVDPKSFWNVTETFNLLDFSHIRFVGVQEAGEKPLICKVIHALNNLTVNNFVLVGIRLSSDSLGCFGDIAPLTNITVTNIISLNVSRNLIELNIGDEIEPLTDLQTLQTLDLSRNKIRVGVSFRKLMPRLRVLDLSFNAIFLSFNALNFTSRTGSPTLTSLKTLRLIGAFDRSSRFRDTSRGNITWFKGLTALEELDLSGNADLCRSMKWHQLLYLFKGLTKLTTLNLARTYVGKIDASQKGHILHVLESQQNSLTTLNLTNSFITDYHMPIVGGLRKLEVLDLTSNRLGRVLPEWFDGLVSLKKLFISDNKLALISGDAFTSLSNLEIIELGNNAFSCECALRYFSRWLHDHAVEIYSENQTGKIVVPDLEDTICLAPVYGCNVTGYNPSEYDCDIALGLGTGFGCLAAVLILILAPAYCYNRTDLRYRLARRSELVMSKHSEELQPLVDKSDAYVCYDKDNAVDCAWVDEYIEGQLADCKEVNIKVQYSNGNSEKKMADQLSEYNDYTRHFLLIITENFIENVWPAMEEYVGQMTKADKRKFVIVYLTKEGLPMSLKKFAKSCKTHTWPEISKECTTKKLEHREEEFWKELRLTLKDVPWDNCHLLCNMHKCC